MANIDPSTLRSAKAFAKQEYEKQLRERPAPGSLERIGPPYWDRHAWEDFKAHTGRYPTISEGDLPNLDGCPDWAYELMGMRPPPVRTTTGSAGATYPTVNDLPVWKMR